MGPWPQAWPELCLQLVHKGKNEKPQERTRGRKYRSLARVSSGEAHTGFRRRAGAETG